MNDQDLIIVFADTAPVAKPRMTQRDKWQKRPGVVRYHAFKDELLVRAKEAGYRPGMNVWKIDVIACIPIPKSWSKKKKNAHEGQPHRQKPDADNILKAVCDALLADDSGVWDMAIRKKWAVKPAITVYIFCNNEEKKP